MAEDIATILLRRIGQDFDGECHLTDDEARQAAAELARLRSLLGEAGKEIGWQDIRLATGEGKLAAKDVLGAVNVILNARRRSLLVKLEEGE